MCDGHGYAILVVMYVRPYPHFWAEDPFLFHKYIVQHQTLVGQIFEVLCPGFALTASAGNTGVLISECVRL